MTAELALTKPDPTMDHQQLKTMMEAAQRYVASGLLPSEVNTPQKALVVMTAGRELGVPATYALRNIHVVKGKPVCSAELLLALVRRTYGPSAIRVSKTTNTACTVQYREQGWDGVSEYTFTMDDAKQAGVTGNNTWRQYPAAMLRARCISAVVRFAFPEAIAGLYTPEEMGAEVVVSDDGAVEKVVEVIDVTPTVPEEGRALEGPDIRLNVLGDPVCQVDRDGRMCGDPVAEWEETADHPARDRFWVAQWQSQQDGYGMPLCLGHYMGIKGGSLAAVRGPSDVMTRAEREDLEGCYVDFADRAVTLGHKHAEKLKVTKPDELDDAVLAASARTLSMWLDELAKQPATV